MYIIIHSYIKCYIHTQVSSLLLGDEDKKARLKSTWPPAAH